MAAPYADWADDRFPHMPGFRVGEGALIDLPHRGNRLAIRCLACGREGHISGRRLAVEFTQHLRIRTERFVSALRCSACASRRLLASVVADPGAGGFQTGPDDTGPIVWSRRLHSWLSEVGADVFAFHDMLRDCPQEPELIAIGIRPHGT